MRPGKTHLSHPEGGFMAGGSIFFGLCHGEHDIKDGLVRGDYRKVKVRSMLDLRQLNIFMR